jgi:hypothetical protein
MLLSPVLVLSACSGAGAPEGALPMLDGPDFFDRPFPSDSRMVDGHPDVSGFPGEGEFPLVDSYLAAASEIDGFGTSSPFYLRFETPIDTSVLPTPEESTKLSSPVMLVDVDRQSPHRGERIPLTFQWTLEETAFQPSNLLAIAPVYGFPLRPHTTYAIVMRQPLAKPGAQTGVWGIDGDPAFLPIAETLAGLGIGTNDVSLAVPFTTQDPTAEMASIANYIHGKLGHVPFEPELTVYDERGDYTVYTGYVTVPIWQEGQRPYRSEGGGFVFDADGTPVVQGWERIHFAMTIPAGPEPAGGWPVVLYSHGTGGDYLTFCERGNTDEEGGVMARQGVAMIGVSQPLHADRSTPDTDTEMDSFNFMNPDAGRTNFRQGALDQVYLARLLTETQPTFTVDNTTIHLDPGRVAFFGHSQGGLVGAIGAPFMSPDLVAAGFSGTGGGLGITIVERKDPFDIAQIVTSLLQFDEGEELTTLHPVVGLIQMLSEVTDPINYGPSWFAEEPRWDSRPLPILLTEGLNDAETPSLTTESLAAAARIPIIGTPVTDPEALDLRGIDPVGVPSEKDARDWNHDGITAGLGQFPDDNHFAIYDNVDARKLYREFLDTALDGEPEMVNF